MPAAPFRARLVRHSRGVGLVEVAGEVDMHTAQELGEVLAEAVADEPERLIVDLTAVGFIDSIGLSVLVRSARQALAAGAPFAVVCNGGLMPVFELAGLPEVLTFHEKLEDALAT